MIVAQAEPPPCYRGESWQDTLSSRYLGNMGTLRLQMLFLLSLLVPPLACHRSPDPDARAAELLEKSQGDDEWAQNFWKKEPKNWDLGLKATVAWKETGS